jgi:hypothetical protein
MTATIHQLPGTRREQPKDFGLSAEELATIAKNLRRLHRKGDDDGVLCEERFLLVRAIFAIASGCSDPRALAESVVVIMDRASEVKK